MQHKREREKPARFRNEFHCGNLFLIDGGKSFNENEENVKTFDTQNALAHTHTMRMIGFLQCSFACQSKKFQDFGYNYSNNGTDACQT